jgi:hypothetical protein
MHDFPESWSPLWPHHLGQVRYAIDPEPKVPLWAFWKIFDLGGRAGAIERHEQESKAW